MYLKRSLSLVGVLGVAAAILIATAGAARGPEKPQAKFHFTSTATVLKYLKSHGVNTRGMVVQRGVRNYAGPKCPGKGWNCTRARHVVQFSTLSSSFSCSSSYGTPALPYPPTPVSSPPNNCVVVQVKTTGAGNNNATCYEQTSNAGPTQNCQIWQENVGGKNNATIVQLINQSSDQQQDGHQNAYVTQQNTTGQNNSAVAQTIWQTTSTNNSLVPDQDQQASQFNQITQNASDGGTQFSVMSQAVVQKATAAAFTDSQNQYGDGDASVDQWSAGKSQSYNFQNMLQRESAPKNSGVSQDQIGPYRCCSSQQSNPADVFYLEQAKAQFTTSATSTVALKEDGSLVTSGHGHIDQFAQQNNSTGSKSCDVINGACVAHTTGANGVITSCSDSGGEPSCSVPCPPSICGDFAALSLAPKASPNHRAFGLHRNR